ncbi:MAG: M81 family metallopeptidase [Candidatus Bathyarchaeota archaeon]|nr:MAG: M81 family metallopeptidase [Candidatus Bathyarchaeota archaeon]
MLRIAVGGISHETNTFNPIPTGLEAFRILREEELLKNGATRPLLESGIDVIPAIHAAAPPSGLIGRRAYTSLREELLSRIEAAGKLDGICLFLHGAMEVEGVGDGETDLVRSIRQVVGNDVLISASLDLHGNITPELVRITDILTAYRTAPHIDALETRTRAATLLANCIGKEKKPVSVMVKPPILLPGEMAVTSVEPAASLYRRLPGVIKSRCVLDSSILVGMAWADTPNASASVIVVAEDTDCRDQAYGKACGLAEEIWSKREEFCLDAPSGAVDETIEITRSYPKKPVFISDSGDNITGGAAGDNPLFVERLTSLNVEDALVAGIMDPAAVTLCRKVGVGNRTRLEIGGKLDRIDGQPLEIEGKVTNISDDGVAVRIGSVDVILTAHWKAFTTLKDFRPYGIDPLERQIVVVKQGYLFPELRRAAAFSLMALSPGFTNLQLDQLRYRNVRRPIYPLDKEFTWEPPLN